MSRYLILGATGTLGTATTKELLKRSDTEQIICLSRDELKQVGFARQFPDPRVKMVIGDIRDYESIERHFKGIDTVFHFAALKRIPEMEMHPLESLKTNVNGTINAAKAAEAFGVKHFVFSSTDKACRPINTYGACKFLSEQILFSLNHDSKVSFSVYRWGNVLGSRGSVIHDFEASLKAGKPLLITDYNMSRFWIKIEDAVNFILDTYQNKGHNTPRIPEMKAAPVTKLAMAVAERHPGTFMAQQTGLRPGEKIHEDIIYLKKECDTVNSHNGPQYSDEEISSLVKEVLG